ncbi:hypothetical protein MKW98_031843, partial [Papaver atlanticum]
HFLLSQRGPKLERHHRFSVPIRRFMVNFLVILTNWALFLEQMTASLASSIGR